MDNCYNPCTCDNSVAGNTYTRCNYGGCKGYKCQSCGAWMFPQWGATCSRYLIPRADTPDGGVEILLQEVAKEMPDCSCGWSGLVDWAAHGQRCPVCGEDLT